jgi:hypothetical protein
MTWKYMAGGIIVISREKEVERKREEVKSQMPSDWLLSITMSLFDHPFAGN